MSKKFLAIIAVSICSLTLLCSEEPIEKNRVPLGERGRTKNVEAGVENSKKNIAQDQRERFEAQSMIPGDEASSDCASLHAFSYTSHPGAYHSPIAIYDATGTIVLEDESVWTIYWGDVYKVANWISTDPYGQPITAVVVIKPHRSIFSTYRYELVNQNTGVKVLADIYLGPYYGNPYRHWITAIDYYNNVIYLEDGTIWSMSMFDGGTISEWLPNDTVIIGVTDGLLNPNFLLNVNLLTEAKGVVVNL